MTTLTLEATCAGRSSLFRRTRTVNYGSWMVKVDADGYLPWEHGLEDDTRESRFHEKDATPPPIRIRLKPAS